MYTVENQYNKTELHSLGNFHISSDKMIVSDPCYEVGIWCQGVLENVRSGIWRAFTRKGQTGWGNRTWEIFVVHSDYPAFMNISEKMDFTVGVDSGQAGFFDPAKFHGDDRDNGGSWYELCCDTTLTNLGAGVLDGGAVSDTGFGDGVYACFVARDADRIVGAKIVFILQEDEVEQEQE